MGGDWLETSNWITFEWRGLAAISPERFEKVSASRVRQWRVTPMRGRRRSMCIAADHILPAEGPSRSAQLNDVDCARHNRHAPSGKQELNVAAIVGRHGFRHRRHPYRRHGLPPTVHHHFLRGFEPAQAARFRQDAADGMRSRGKNGSFLACLSGRPESTEHPQITSDRSLLDASQSSGKKHYSRHTSRS